MANNKNIRDKIDINNFVINYVIRGIMINPSDNIIMWAINQIEDPTLSVSSEQSNSVDALGSVLASFNRGKTAEFSANQCIFDLSLFAAQSGTEKKVASKDNIIIVPMFETLEIPITYINLETEDDVPLITNDGVFLTDGTESEITVAKLKNIPINTPNVIYKMKNDGTLGNKMFYSAELSEGSYTYSNGILSFLKQDVNYKDKYLVIYEYESNSAISVSNTAIDLPKHGRFILEVLGCDVCDQSTLIHAYLIFPNAVLDANVDLNFTTDGKHPFTIFARQNMCDKEKVLFRLVIPEQE